MTVSLFRTLTHRALTALTIDGEILDVGGDARSAYRNLLHGRHRFTTLNLNPDVAPDLNWDIEQTPWPVSDQQFDAVLLINVLEHIYSYATLLKESHRALKDGGIIVIVVPFLYYIHPSPHDYFRFTEEALKKLLAEQKFAKVEVSVLGYGAFSAGYHMIHRFSPSPLHWIFARLIIVLDRVVAKVVERFGRKYRSQDYPLGYLVVANRL